MQELVAKASNNDRLTSNANENSACKCTLLPRSWAEKETKNMRLNRRQVKLEVFLYYLDPIERE